MSNEQPTKTLLSVIFKNIASKYEDLIVMVPLTKIDSSILCKLFNGVMNAITTIDYDVLVSIIHGHSSFVNLYKNEPYADKATSFIPHPLDQHRFLYLFYDTTHSFKCIYNNFQEDILWITCSLKSELYHLIFAI